MKIWAKIRLVLTSSTQQGLQSALKKWAMLSSELLLALSRRHAARCRATWWCSHVASLYSAQCWWYSDKLKKQQQQLNYRSVMRAQAPVVASLPAVSSLLSLTLICLSRRIMILSRVWLYSVKMGIGKFLAREPCFILHTSLDSGGRGFENSQRGPLFFLYFWQFKKNRWPSSFRRKRS